jgi:adenylate cyclase
VAETIWEQRDQFWDGGRPRAQRLTATVLFTDLKGFTTMSEKMDPDVLIEWLNDYMETMAGLVMVHGGVIDDYAGDGFKADFGVPLPRASENEMRQDAVNAVECALAMEQRLKQLNAVWERQSSPTTQMRIGICTGPVVAGSLGSSERLKYTTVGDTVNTASRLESFVAGSADDRSGDGLCRILISETTLRYLENGFDAEKLGDFKLKGKAEKVPIYRLLGRSKPDTATERHQPGTA